MPSLTTCERRNFRKEKSENHKGSSFPSVASTYNTVKLCILSELCMHGAIPTALNVKYHFKMIQYLFFFFMRERGREEACERGRGRTGAGERQREKRASRDLIPGP